ncbi:MAG: CHAT domain-containing tetratricopeptide repeat protein, partial [Spirulinaceae cyanobacterium]
GNSHLVLGNYGQAIESLKNGLNITIEINQLRRRGELLGSLGNTYFTIGDYPKAIQYYEQSLAIAREIKDRRGEGAALGNLGSAYFSLGYNQKAIQYHEQSLAIAREIKNPQGEQASLGNLSNIYYFQGDYQKAIQYREQSLAIARQLNDLESEANSLGGLGLIYRDLEEYSKAIQYQQNVLNIAQQINNPELEALALHNLGLVFFESGDLEKAEKNLMKAIKVRKSSRDKIGERESEKVSFFDREVKTYSTLQQVLVAQDKLETALEISELSRARVFIELLTRNLSPHLSEQLIINQSVLSIEKIKNIARNQKATVVEYSIIYEDSRTEEKLKPQTSKLYIWVVRPTGEVKFRQVDLKNLLNKQGKSVGEIVANTREYMIKGVSRGSTNSNELNLSPGDFVKLESDLPNWEPWEVVAVEPENGTVILRFPSWGREVPSQEYSLAEVVEVVESSRTYNRDLQQLHQILIEPITDLLPTDPDEHIIFIPHRELFLVPFPALQDNEGKYLIEKHTILTAPAIEVLDKTNQRRQQVPGDAQDILVVGNPTMPKVSFYPGEKPEQLSPLENSEKEAKEVAQLLQAKPITGGQATETAIKPILSNAKLIHLATHGLLDNFRGLNSAIALAPSESDNGLLTAEEILDLKLNAELVVLSACNTGQGRLTGDGVIGLSRSLIAAGVPSVIVSLWSVPDAPTAELMTEFYRNFQANPNKAQALRQAMLTTMETHPNPIDWAAFT